MYTPLTDAIKLNAGTFDKDNSLPKLPVPEIAETFQLYLTSIKAISEENIDYIESKIELFIESNESKILQTELKSRSEYTSNWLEKWWLEEAYLKDRSPVIPYLNIGGRSILYKSVWPIIDSNVSYPKQISDEVIYRSARYIYSILLFWICLRLQMVIPHTSKDNKPLCMNQMRNVFNTCRVPGEMIDSLHNSFRTSSESKCPSHIVIGCSGRIFAIHIVTDDNKIYSVVNIQKALKEIIEFCIKHGEGPSIATLTSLPRDKWGLCYNQIRDICNKNAENIDLIESSIVWVCLSTEEGANQHLLLEKALKVDARNIWADKSLYISFLSNGLITYGANHAPIDGIALGTAMSFAEKEIPFSKQADKCQLHALKTIGHIDSSVLWQELTFKLPKGYSKIIEKAYLEYLERCSNMEAQTFTFSTFSRSIARQMKLHPDTVFQLCLQLAYARIHEYKYPATVYETASTRLFTLGRTETIRSCTIQAVAWIKGIIDLGPTDPRVIKLFLKAHEAHNALRTRCETGRGCDRHMLGLRMVSNIAPHLKSPLLEEIINDPSYAATGSNGTFKLSTSPVGAADCLATVAPMCPQGYGVFYRIVDDCCEAAVTSWRSEGHGRGARLLEELNSCFRLVALMHMAAQKAKL